MKTNPYETQRLLSEYLIFHYVSEKGLLPKALRKGAAEGNFSSRCARLCRKYVRCSGIRALDLGCAVGGTSFELSRFCSEVMALDYSSCFVEAARRIQRDKIMVCKMKTEGDLLRDIKVHLPKGVQSRKVQFEVGDAQNLPKNLGMFDLILAANLIDRLKKPEKCLGLLQGLIQPNGILIITSPYTWLEEFTPKKNWLGGYRKGERKIFTREKLREKLDRHFVLLGREDIPFIIREHNRKFQYSLAEATVWRRKNPPEKLAL